MTNDTSTVAGALQECIDHLEDNLAAKGVTASYAPSTGMIGLIDEILNIPTCSCYHIEFSKDSYVAVGGSATLEVYLQSNYAPLGGATVTVTGSDSSLYTGITDNNGRAIVTVPVNSDTTFTATYNNVTDTCTVTVGPSYLFYDACDSASGLSNYGSSIQMYKGSGTGTISYNSTQNSYYITGNDGYAIIIPIIPMENLDNYKLTFQYKHQSTGAFCQPSVFVYDKNVSSYPTVYGVRHRGDKIINCQKFANNVDTSANQVTVSDASNQWFTLEMTKNGTNLSFKIKNSSDAVIYDKTYNSESLNATACALGMWTEQGQSYGWYMKEIKAESL